MVDRAREAGQVRPDVHAPDIGMITLMVGSAAELSHDVRPDLRWRYSVLLLDGLRSGCAGPTPLPAAPPALEELERALATQRPRRR